MVKIHNLGFPRIGPKREFAVALEQFCSGDISSERLLATAASIRSLNWEYQEYLDFVPVGDFSLYDHVLDHSLLFRRVSGSPEEKRVRDIDDQLNVVKRINDLRSHCHPQWFNTKYHYVKPQVRSSDNFKLDDEYYLEQVCEALRLGVKAKPVLLGPVSYLKLSESMDGSNPLCLLGKLLPLYTALLDKLYKLGLDWVQIDEPFLATDLNKDDCAAFLKAYQLLAKSPSKILLTSYFGELDDNVDLVLSLPVEGLHIDAIQYSDQVTSLVDLWPQDRVLSLGVIDGQNVWKSNLNQLLDWLEPVSKKRSEIWLAPSCSLLHSPLDLSNERAIDADIKSWLAFAVQKLDELCLLKAALEFGRDHVKNDLTHNRLAVDQKLRSQKICNPIVQFALLSTKRNFSNHDAKEYLSSIPNAKKLLIFNDVSNKQPEFHYMVDYFAERLDGIESTDDGWVQMAGSNCVKPPIIYGDVYRPKNITVRWIEFAQSYLSQSCEGALIGPMSLLNSSFVRNDLPSSIVSQHLALAMREEIKELSEAGLTSIKLDESACLSGMPLRFKNEQVYLSNIAVVFKLATEKFGKPAKLNFDFGGGESLCLQL